jgi:hypothetical protein
MNEYENKVWHRKYEFIDHAPKPVVLHPHESFHKYHVTKCSQQAFVVPWQMNQTNEISGTNDSERNFSKTLDGNESI